MSSTASSGLYAGAPWRDLPENFGPCTTYNRFVRWRRVGIWTRMMSALAGAAAVVWCGGRPMTGMYPTNGAGAPDAAAWVAQLAIEAQLGLCLG